jgi:hypothetical protein
LLWLCDQLAIAHHQVDLGPDVYIWLLKQIKGGNDGQDNIWLCSAVLDSLQKNM